MEKTQDVRSLVQKYQANCERIGAIADACEKENRERNEAENAEYTTLTRENQLLQMRMQALRVEENAPKPDALNELQKTIRENVMEGRKTKIELRDAITTTKTAAGGLQPLYVQEIVKPLMEGLIYDKVGLPFLTGLSGDYVWPLYDLAEASVVGEGVALSDAAVNLSKVTPSPQRIGIAIPVSNQAINRTEGAVETVVRDIMPKAIQKLINKIIFGNTYGSSSTSGILVAALTSANNTALTATPTFAQLNAAKAKVLTAGVDGSAMCWVMSKSMKATLEGTPINEKGIYVPIVQNDMLCGLPIYTTQDAAFTTGSGSTAKSCEHIFIGDFNYLPAGLFGEMRFVVDPYSQARKDCVDFVLNTDFAANVLIKNAFQMLTVTPA